MPQADGYVRIVTQNDTTDAQRSTEQLGDTIRDSLDTTPVDRMSGAFSGVQRGVEDTGSAAVTTGQLIKANLISDVIMQGVQRLGESLKNAAVHTVEVADGVNSSVNKIAAATGAGVDDMERLKGIVEEIYGDNFGESFDDIADSVAKIKQNLGDLDDKELVSVTESAFALRDVFDYDIAESSRAVRAMVDNFGISAAEAFDYIARGAQNGLDYSGELLDSISEYSVQFKKMGLSADDMFTIFAEGAENGAWNLDKVGDSVKELAIRVIDGSNTSRQGFEALGFEAESMAEKFAEGGIAAKVAFQEVITALSEMDNSAEQNIAGVNLLGTMWEDMGADAVLALGNISDSAYDCAGAMDEIKEVNYDDLSNSIENVKRQIDLLIQPIGESLIPTLDDAADTVAELAQEGDIKEIAVGVSSFISGTLTLLLENLNLILSAVTGITAAVIAFKAANMLIGVIQSWQNAALQVKLFAMSEGAAALQTAATNGTLTLQEIIYAALSGKISIATASTAAFNTVLAMNPAGAIAAVIGLLATAITGFALSASDASEETDEFNDTLKNLKDTTNDSIADGEAELAMLKKKVERYDQLRTSVSLTANEQKELSGIASELQNTLGDEAEVVNSLTGEYNDLSTAVDKYITKKHNELLQSAYEEEAKSALKLIFKNQRESDELSEELFDLENMYSSDDYEGASEADGYSKSDAERIEWIKNRLQEIEKENATLQRSVDEYDSIYSKNLSLGGSDYTSSINYSTDEDKPVSQWQQEIAEDEELFKAWREAAKYSYDMGEKDAAEYYATLKQLRDEYLNPSSEEYHSVSLELHKYEESLTAEQKKAYEKQLAEQEKVAKAAQTARKQAYNDEKSQLEFRLRTGKISEKKYYDELAKIRDKYLDKNSAEWRDAYLETYEYNQKIIQENKDALNTLLSDSADSTLSALQKITAARDSLTAKLTDFNKTFEKVTETVPETVAVKGEFTITTAEHEVESYKMGADSIEDNIKILEEYGAMLDALKARGADDSTMSSILDMDIEEGMEFGTELLKMSESEWNDYFTNMEKLRQTAADISEKYYQSEVESLKNNFIDKLREELDGLGTDMYKIGADVAKEFVSGWNEALGTKDLTLGELMRSVNGGTLDTAPRAAQQQTARDSKAVASAAGSVLSAVRLPIYIGGDKLAEILIDAVNGKIIKDGKNVLLT